MGTRRVFRWLAAASVLGAALVAAPGAHAQQATSGVVRGRVVEATAGAPVVAAQVSVVGTNLGGLTNAQGEFTIRGVPTGQQRVRAIRVGFAEQSQVVTVVAGDNPAVEFRMQAVAVSLNPVVTTATGEQRRVEVGNAIAQVNAAEVVETRPVTNMGDLLTARAPGVQVLPGNQTGTGARVRIRGTSSLSLSNDPIYVIDGVRMQSSSNSTSIDLGGSTPSRVGDINPEEIESIEVVKGPSAATLYGTDAANGVIVITTKRGQAGAPQWTFYTEQTAVTDDNPWPANYAGVGTFVNRTGAAQYTESCFLTRQGNAATASTHCTLDSLAAFNPAKTEGISPIGTGHRQQYGLQVRGGSEAVRFFVSGEWEDEQGPQKLPSLERERLLAEGTPVRDWMERPNVFNRASARANLNATLSPELDVVVNAGYVQSNTTMPQSDNNASAWGPTLLGGLGVVDPDDHTTAYGFYAPGNIYQSEYNQGINRFIGSTNANWRPLDWLAMRANFGLDFTNRVDTQLCRFTECTSGTEQEGYKVDNRSRFTNYTADVSGTGTFQLTDAINSRTTLGLQFYREVFNRNGATGEQLPPGATTVTAAAIPSADEATTESRTLGFFIQQDLAFSERLFLTAALRSDDNSAFGADFDAVYYPKLSLSWVASDEPFFPRPDWMDQLRLRAAYGASGRQPGTTDAVQYYSSVTAISSGSEAPGVVFSALGNTELKPERSAELELGIDGTFLDNRLTTELTFYDKRSRDALVQRVLPPSGGTGLTSRFENLGEIRNWGWEWLVNAQLLRRENFGWDLSVNGSHNSNKIVDLGGVPPIRGDQISEIEGYPLFSYWVRPIEGFADADNDGIIEANEVTIAEEPEFYGYSQPRLEVAVTSGIDFWQRRLRLSALVDHKGGHKVWNGSEQYRCTSFVNCRDIYDPNTPLDLQARAIAAGFVTNTTEAGYIEDASFIRLREVALNFDVPQAWYGRLLRGSDRMTLNLAARNLAVWTDYTGMDPESNYAQDNIQNDFLTSPPPTYYVLRLTVGF